MADLSPAAQAALDAVDQVPRVLNCTQDHPLFAAAALRAVANEVVPYESLKGCDQEAWLRDEIRQQLLAIAAELEGLDA